MDERSDAPKAAGVMDTAMARWSALPRAARWLVYATVGVAAFYGVVDPVLAWTNNLNTKSDTAALLLRQYDTQEQSRSNALSRIALGTAAFGTVALPKDDPSLVSRVSNEISNVLTDRGVTGWSMQTQRGSSLGSSVLKSLVKSETEELQRVSFTVTLTDRTSTVLGVIADLEALPEITTIASVRLNRLEKGKDRIQAILTPEVWVIVPKERAR